MDDPEDDGSRRDRPSVNEVTRLRPYTSLFIPPGDQSWRRGGGSGSRNTLVSQSLPREGECYILIAEFRISPTQSATGLLKSHRTALYIHCKWYGPKLLIDDSRFSLPLCALCNARWPSQMLAESILSETLKEGMLHLQLCQPDSLSRHGQISCEATVLPQACHKQIGTVSCMTAHSSSLPAALPLL